MRSGTRQRTAVGTVAGFLKGSTAAGLAISIGGCIPNAVVPKPALDVPATYREAGAKGGLQDHATDWWRTFQVFRAHPFMEETEIANLDVAAAIAQVEQADALAQQQGSALYPSITANDTVTRSKSSGNIFNGVSSGGTVSSLGSSTGSSSSSLVTGIEPDPAAHHPRRLVRRLLPARFLGP